MEVVGLTRSYRLTEVEWAELMAEEDSPHHTQQATRELPYLQISRAVLAEKQQLLPGRDLLRGQSLSVLRGNSHRDQERMYHRSVAEDWGLKPSEWFFVTTWSVGTLVSRPFSANSLICRVTRASPPRRKVAIIFRSQSRNASLMRYAGSYRELYPIPENCNLIK
jgi:hypothetical protein